MPISLEEFKSFFSGKFWKTLTKKTLIPLEEEVQKDAILNDLYEKVSSRTYSPSPSRSFIVINKGNSVSRVVPIFQVQDSCFYFFCIKNLEPYISGNRTPNTYGGWVLGGIRREKEEQEANYIGGSFREYETPDGGTIVLDESEEYAIESSFDPQSWRAQWGDFMSKLYIHSRAEHHGWAAEMDIANFYDSIRLDILERKIRDVVPGDKQIYVDFLFGFLKKINAVGVPQDEIADCSRILANFYLSGYDQEMSNYCDQIGSKYFRYSDDQVIFAEDEGALRSLVCYSSLNLIRLGLSINQKKVRLMPKANFDNFYAFNWFITYGDRKDGPIVDAMIDDYLQNGGNIRNRGISLLLRIINLLSPSVSKDKIAKILSEITRDSILESPKFRVVHMKKIYDVLEDEDKEKFLECLEEASERLIHNSFHYQILQFFSLIGRDPKLIKDRIAKLDKFYSSGL